MKSVNLPSQVNLPWNIGFTQFISSKQQLFGRSEKWQTAFKNFAWNEVFEPDDLRSNSSKLHCSDSSSSLYRYKEVEQKARVLDLPFRVWLQKLGFNWWWELGHGTFLRLGLSQMFKPAWCGRNRSWPTRQYSGLLIRLLNLTLDHLMKSWTTIRVHLLCIGCLGRWATRRNFTSLVSIYIGGFD